MTTSEASKILKLYQYGDDTIQPHSFDLNSETVWTILEALAELNLEKEVSKIQSAHLCAFDYSKPVMYKANRKDNGEIVESPCVYATADGSMYLGTRNTPAAIGMDGGNIYSVLSTNQDIPLFVEVDANTLEWSGNGK